ncbi:hypothetical protein X798_02435 [Onchocerca flexuosa]|uniref:Uncharacterized protein n=1 Tax=Onchocerca flexuosa TaxID=387005 RepID=A0A238C0M0_9BILA|nr:hypothetical protein X798_02435 [Onchocerca flexuosa]
MNNAGWKVMKTGKNIAGLMDITVRFSLSFSLFGTIFPERRSDKILIECSINPLRCWVKIDTRIEQTTFCWIKKNLRNIAYTQSKDSLGKFRVRCRPMQ